MQGINIVVSVVVITYLQEKYIKQALDSILSQQVNFDYEILIGEDCSPDNTRQILLEYRDKYPNKIKLFLRDMNLGPTKNYLDICLHCTGKYITLLEGDDYWIDDNKLQKQFDFLESHSDYIAVSHKLLLQYSDGQFGEKTQGWLNDGHTVTMQDLLARRFFSISATMHRNFYRDKERSREFCKLLTINDMVGDLTIALYLLNLGRVYVFKDAMAVYRSRNDKNESNYNSQRNYDEICVDHIVLLNANNDFYKQKYNFFELYKPYLKDLFLFCIKNKTLKRFNEVFATVPKKVRWKFMFMLTSLWLYQVYKDSRSYVAELLKK